MCVADDHPAGQIVGSASAKVGRLTFGYQHGRQLLAVDGSSNFQAVRPFPLHSEQRKDEDHLPVGCPRHPLAYFLFSS